MSQPLLPFESTVVKTMALTPRVKCVRFECPPDHPLGLMAGQHIQVLIPTSAGPKKGYFSVASSPQDHSTFEVCVTLQGGSLPSTFIHNLKVGDRVQVMGPAGNFHLNPGLNQDVVFVATGSGIAPLRSMILDLYHRKFSKSVNLLFGNRTEEDIIYKNEWIQLEKDWPSFHATFVLSRPLDSWEGYKGRVHDVMEKALQNPGGSEYYLCGQSPMVASFRDKLLALHVPEDRIHYEKYG